jgi:hypothetical protein
MESLSVDKTWRYFGISRLRSGGFGLPGRRYGMLHHVLMVEFILALPGALRVFFRSRRDTAIEILALRQPVAVLKRTRPRPKLNTLDRLASRRVSAQLEAAVPATLRPAEDHLRDSCSDPTPGGRAARVKHFETPGMGVY